MKSARLLISIAVAVFIVCVSGSSLLTKEDGTPIKNGVGYTGGIREQGRTCGTTLCHFVTGGGNIFQRDSLINSNVPPAGYLSGQSYEFTVTLTEPFRIKYGYMASPQANNATGDARGTLWVVDDSSQLRTGSNYIAMTHTLAGTAAPNETKTWRFNWTAPSPVGLGEVLFFVACNASNNDDSTLGDRIYLDTLFIPEALNNGVNDLFLSQGITAAVSPNPTSGLAAVTFDAPMAKEVEVGIVGVNGETVIPSRSCVIRPGGKVGLDLREQRPGTYLVVMRAGGKSSTLKLVKY